MKTDKLDEHNFNALTPAETERLAILAEECGEVVQVVGKILRHGYESYHPADPATTNRELLMRELGDLRVVERMMNAARDVYESPIFNSARAKAERIKQYLHHTPFVGEDLLAEDEKTVITGSVGKTFNRAMLEEREKAQSPQNNFGMAPAPVWEKREDELGNDVWRANSPYHNDGDPMVYELRPRLVNNKVEWYFSGDEDLAESFANPGPWASLEAAQAACAEDYQEILEVERIKAKPAKKKVGKLKLDGKTRTKKL